MPINYSESSFKFVRYFLCSERQEIEDLKKINFEKLIEVSKTVEKQNYDFFQIKTKIRVRHGNNIFFNLKNNLYSDIKGENFRLP